MLLELVAHRLGQVVTAPGGLGGECVDWTNVYLESLGRPLIHANAIEWSRLEVKGFAWTANTPYNAPTLGSLVVWREWSLHSIGPSGHIAIAIAADNLVLVTVDQNWPDGAPVRLVVHDYGGVLGWHRPL